MISSFPELGIKGKGQNTNPPSKPLDRACKSGDIVKWGGNIGELKEWEGNKAYIKTPKGMSIVEVTCNV